MRILLITDTWKPQVNGVVTTISYLVDQIQLQSHTIVLIHPGLFPTVPLFCNKSISWVTRPWQIQQIIQAAEADAIHIFTEGPLGFFARLFCGSRRIPFTTSYHTRFPEFVQHYLGIPQDWTYRIVNWIHAKSEGILVPTEGMIKILKERLPSCKNKLILWTRGVDRQVFNPSPLPPSVSVSQLFSSLKRPIVICVSRLDPEKGLDDFCRLPSTKFTKVLVGDGQERRRLESTYGHSVILMGYKMGNDLATIYSLADCSVFPSLVDTFGNVMVESMACGTPVAAYRVTGPVDVILEGVSGHLAEVGDQLGLSNCVEACLRLNRSKVHKSSFKWDLEKCGQEFLSNLSPIQSNVNGNERHGAGLRDESGGNDWGYRTLQLIAIVFNNFITFMCWIYLALRTIRYFL